MSAWFNNHIGSINCYIIGSCFQRETVSISSTAFGTKNYLLVSLCTCTDTLQRACTCVQGIGACNVII